MAARHPKKWLSLSAGMMLLLLGCGGGRSGDAPRIKIIQLKSGHCNYAIEPYQFDTLTDIGTLSGKLGTLAVNANDLNPKNSNLLRNRSGFQKLDLNFAKSGSTYDPLDITTLYAASLYAAIEKGYHFFANLDGERADLLKVVPNISDLLIVYDAKMEKDDHEATDNAAYIGYPYLGDDGKVQSANYFLSLPIKRIKSLPLGFNMGVMVHEFTHFVFNTTFTLPRLNDNIFIDPKSPTFRALAAMNEGTADYFGYLYTQDPNFVGCSEPTSARDLSLEKNFTDEMASQIETGENFEPHRLGAVWASIQYRIAEKIGAEKNGKYLLNLMSTLKNCPEAKAEGAFSIDFSILSKCHLKGVPAGDAKAIQAVYSSALGPFNEAKK